MLPRRRSTPSISLLAPPASTLPLKRSDAIRVLAAGSLGTSSAERSFTGSLNTAAVDRERADRIAVDGEEAAVDARHGGWRGAPWSSGRSSPATRSFDSTPPSRPSSASRSIVRTFTRHGPPSRAIEVQRTPGATVALSRRSSSEREPSGSSAAAAAPGGAGREQGKQDAGAPAHGPQGGRPCGGCRVPSRAAGSSPGCGCRRGRRPARRTGSCPSTCPRPCSS